MDSKPEFEVKSWHNTALHLTASPQVSLNVRQQKEIHRECQKFNGMKKVQR
jgi:hypothetical protein